MWTLFLDDIRFPADVRYDYGPYKDLVICRSYHDAVWAVEQYGLPKFIAFDHDEIAAMGCYTLMYHIADNFRGGEFREEILKMCGIE